MFPVKKVPKSRSYAKVDKAKADRIVLKGLESKLKRHEEGMIVLSPEFVEEIKDKIKELK